MSRKKTRLHAASIMYCWLCIATFRRQTTNTSNVQRVWSQPWHLLGYTNSTSLVRTTVILLCIRVRVREGSPCSIVEEDAGSSLRTCSHNMLQWYEIVSFHQTHQGLSCKPSYQRAVSLDVTIISVMQLCSHQIVRNSARADWGHEMNGESAFFRLIIFWSRCRAAKEKSM